MEKKRIQKVNDRILRLPGVHSIGIIGDPGCEGLGTYNMKVFAEALTESAKDDITLIAGDLVPTGTERFYETISEMTDVIAENDVYVLRGNHDTGTYETYFGRKNYALLMERFALVVIDNAERRFEEEGLALLTEVLEREDVTKVILTFHIPIPNHFIKNSVSEEEYGKLRAAYKAHRQKLKFLVCGHVHSRFIDEVDGIPLICTGGGGAMIEDVSEDIKASDVEHHLVHFYEKDGELSYEVKNLSEDLYGKERQDGSLKSKLEETVAAELMAHLKYMMFADRAKRRGMERMAKLFYALAASEYYHARNFYSVAEQEKPFAESVGAFIPGEEFEYQKFYRMMASYAEEKQAPLAEQAYKGAAAAEKVHATLLKEVTDLDESKIDTIYVCPICGYVMTGASAPDRCPVCGGPARQFEEY